jgi:hypothetical protein
MFSIVWNGFHRVALRGMVAGFVAKAVLSALMVMKSLMGVMLELDVIAMLAKMIHARPAARGA